MTTQDECLNQYSKLLVFLVVNKHNGVQMKLYIIIETYYMVLHQDNQIIKNKINTFSKTDNDRLFPGVFFSIQ